MKTEKAKEFACGFGSDNTDEQFFTARKNISKLKVVCATASHYWKSCEVSLESMSMKMLLLGAFCSLEPLVFAAFVPAQLVPAPAPLFLPTPALMLPTCSAMFFLYFFTSSCHCLTI